MIENGRIVQNRYDAEAFTEFIKKVEGLDGFILKMHKPPMHNTLQERYLFNYNRKRVSIVFETNSRTLVVTAEESILDLLRPLLNLPISQLKSTTIITDQPKLSNSINNQLKPTPSINQVKASISPLSLESKEQKLTAQKPKETRVGITKQAEVEKKLNLTVQRIEAKIEKAAKNSPIKNDEKLELKKSLNNDTIQKLPSKQSQEQPTEISIKQPQDQLPKSSKKPLEVPSKQLQDQLSKSFLKQQKQDEESKALDELYKNGFSIKKYQPERLEIVLKNIKTLKGVTSKQTASDVNSRTYLISDKKSKVYLRFQENKRTLQLQGKRSKLFGEVQVLVSQGSDYVTAVSSHIDLTGEEKRAKDMEKRLKKLLPNAFDFLSEQSRIDLTIGMIDIGNDEVKLSDYSMLLVPPYRGLERLIYDLQKAKNIEVKMIGQAFEKQGGDYTLKLGYKRKIGSIVYAEVMRDLYTEYFAKRNFYAHSDITGDLLSRVITEKSAVKEIFTHLIQIIEYNITKLKEIGFKIPTP